MTAQWKYICSPVKQAWIVTLVLLDRDLGMNVWVCIGKRVRNKMKKKQKKKMPRWKYQWIVIGNSPKKHTQSKWSSINGDTFVLPYNIYTNNAPPHLHQKFSPYVVIGESSQIFFFLVGTSQISYWMWVSVNHQRKRTFMYEKHPHVDYVRASFWILEPMWTTYN